MAKKKKSTEFKMKAHQHPAPDGGWGWAVVLGAHMCIFFGVGWLQTISIYLVPLQEEFGSSSATLGWIVSSGLATTFLSGPLGSFCARKFGARKSCFVGGTILGCGFIASVFAQSPLQLFFTIGIVTGVGCSLVHLSASITTGHYFNKRHAFANGLTWLGSSIGQFVSAPLLQLLIDYYGWRGAVLIEGAFVFNTLVAAALFRPIQHVYKRKPSVAYLETRQRLRKESIQKNNARQGLAINPNSNSLLVENINGAKLQVLSANSLKSNNGTAPMPTNGNCAELDAVSSDQQDRAAAVKTNGALTFKLQPINEDELAQFDEPQNKCLRKSTFFLDNPAVLVVCVVNFLMAYAIQGYYAHVVAKAIISGIAPDAAAFILSTYAIGSLLARLTHGWFIDRKFITPLAMYAMALSAGCVGAFAAVMAESYAGFLASAVILGMSSGIFYPIIPVVMRSLVGLKRMGTAYGIAMVFDGTGVVTGGLMAGLIKDITGDYNISFIQAGATFAVASASITAVILCQKCAKSNDESTGHQPESDPALLP